MHTRKTRTLFMSLNTRSAQIVLPLIMGLIITAGVCAQGSFQSQTSFGVPAELRRFPVAANADRQIPEAVRTDPVFKRFDADRIRLNEPFNKAVGNHTAPDATSAPVPKSSKAQAGGQDGFRMASAIKQSLLFLAIQHGFRMTQDKTTRELGGPFFKDWGRSVKGLQGWRDTDNAFTNYLAHPLQGAITGRIYTANSREGEMAEFGKSRKYLKSRLEALAWSTFWSTQFELGPLSEATIGNVGMTKKNGEGTMGWVDLVMTPTAGTAFLVAEDAIEKYVLKRMLRETGGRVTTGIKIWRSLLTPSMSMTNLLSGRPPWSRRSNFSASMPGNRPGDTGDGSPSNKIEPDKDK